MTQLSEKDREVLDNFNDMTIGQVFRKARETQNLMIDQVAAHLNIGTPHLEAIEADDIHSLPPKVYAIGFVRAYADVLGLNSEKMVYLFKIQCYGARQVEKQKEIVSPSGDGIDIYEAFHQKIDDWPTYIAPFAGFVVVGLIILSVLIWLFSPVVMPENKNNAIVPSVQDITEIDLDQNNIANESNDFVSTNTEDTVLNEPGDLIVKPLNDAKSYGAQPGTAALVFRVVEKSWLEIRTVADGKLLLTRTLDKGDVFYTPPATDIMLTTGNAAGVEAFLDGQSLGLLGKKGEIIRLRPFSVKSLRLQKSN